MNDLELCSTSASRPATLIRTRKVLLVLVLPVACVLVAFTARAQENFEIQVYGSETAAPRTTMIELHSNAALRGTTRKTDGVAPTNRAAHETIEITQGLTPWSEIGFYTFTSIQPDTGWEWVGNHLRPRVRVPESWNMPVGLSLSVEFGYQRREFSTDTWTIEIRPIVDKRLDRWYVSFNPTFERALKGENVRRGFDFAPAAKVSYDVTSKISAGIEYYGSVGPLDRIDPRREQQHLIFPVVDLDLGPRWEFNFGVGFGLTPTTDTYLIKMILGYRFGPLPK